VTDPSAPRRGDGTSVERFIDERAHRILQRLPASRMAKVLVELAVFVLKQGWACVFGGAMLALLFATALWYPDGAALARNDFVTLAAVAIQVLMVVFRLETLRELRVIILFHIVGTGMELFKTSVGSWIYEGDGVLHLLNVPLYSGFMYASVGSYLVRVYRLFDLRFERYPRRWITALLAVLIYVNFFSHHYVWDARWLLLLAVAVVFGPCMMHFRIFRARLRMPLVVAFLLVATFIWVAENIATWSRAWSYPDQVDGWQLVSIAKLGSWLLLMIISVVLVTWVYPPRGLDSVVPGRHAGRWYPDPVPASETLNDQRNDDTFESVWDEVQWRGLVQLSTDEAELKALLSGPPITYYCGFDPTAPSLHLGNLVQLLLMRRFQLAGHKPLGLVGGSTGLIGDPKPTAERTLNTKDTVAEWVGYLQEQVAKFLSFEGDNAARLVNNLDWTAPMSAIDFLRDVGKHYRVGTMLKKDAVSARLNSSEGISYTEFSYQILQGLDYLELFRTYGCVLQTGGSDQWGNLTSGTDLIRKAEGATAHAIGTPLITNSDGTKFGKSEGNAVWLDPALTSPYAFYQFWLNTDDADVVDRLKVFTFLTRAEIEALADAVAADPARRAAQQRLAVEATTLVHGAAAAQAAIAASAALFGQGQLGKLDAATLESALRELPHTTATPGALVTQLLVDTGLTSSLGEARRAIAQGGVYLDNAPVESADAVLPPSAHDRGMAVLRRGKKTLAGVFVE
jgi:tyrosyl-tRNA synthetase